MIDDTANLLVLITDYLIIVQLWLLSFSLVILISQLVKSVTLIFIILCTPILEFVKIFCKIKQDLLKLTEITNLLIIKYLFRIS